MKTDVAQVVKITLAVLGFATAITLAFSPRADASCGCLKPPPEAGQQVLPDHGYQGATVYVYDSQFAAGQAWNTKVTVSGSQFNGSSTVISVKDITDPTGQTFTPVLPFTIPATAGKFGPAELKATKTGKTPVVVPSGDFTVVGAPLPVVEATPGQPKSTTHNQWKTGVGADGELYIPISNLGGICTGQVFTGTLVGTALRFDEEDVLVLNPQGYILDPASPNAEHYTVVPGPGWASDSFRYDRHSFADYCANHLPGGSQVIDPANPDWHQAGTPHVAYAGATVVVYGKINGSLPLSPGNITLTVKVESQYDNN